MTVLLEICIILNVGGDLHGCGHLKNVPKSKATKRRKLTGKNRPQTVFSVQLYQEDIDCCIYTDPLSIIDYPYQGKSIKGCVNIGSKL